MNVLIPVVTTIVSSGLPEVQTSASSLQCTSRSGIAFTISTPGRLLHDETLDLTIHAVGMMDQTFSLVGQRRNPRSNKKLTFKMTEAVPTAEGGTEPIQATLTIHLDEDREAETFTATTARITIDAGKRWGVAQQRYDLEGCQGTFR